MKDYDFKNHEKNIKVASRSDFGHIFLVVSIMMVMGGFCYLGSMRIFISLNELLGLDEKYLNLFYKNISTDIEQARAYVSFSMFLFMLITMLSIIFFGALMWIIKWKFEKYKKYIYYISYKEQINEMLTALIFLLGFIPNMLKFIFTGQQTTIMEELDSVSTIFLMSLLSPYIYSIVLKIYDMNLQRNTTRSYNKHLEIKFKK